MLKPINISHIAKENRLLGLFFYTCFIIPLVYIVCDVVNDFYSFDWLFVKRILFTLLGFALLGLVVSGIAAYRRKAFVISIELFVVLWMILQILNDK